MMKWLLPLVVLTLISCKSAEPISRSGPSEVDILMEVMRGSYTSAEQAMRDSSFYAISLHMYPIWEEKEGNFLYVEQALASKQAAPYRQRIYQLGQLPNGTLISTIYSLVDQERFIGKYAEPDFFDAYGTEILQEREGCTVYLQKISNQYVGHTKDKECKSSLRGATYATTEVTIKSDELVSWDRGFNELDEHIWGSENGGYIFKLIRKQVPNYNRPEQGIRFKDNRYRPIKE